MWYKSFPFFYTQNRVRMCVCVCTNGLLLPHFLKYQSACNHTADNEEWDFLHLARFIHLYLIVVMYTSPWVRKYIIRYSNRLPEGVLYKYIVCIRLIHEFDCFTYNPIGFGPYFAFILIILILYLIPIRSIWLVLSIHDFARQPKHGRFPQPFAYIARQIFRIVGIGDFR